MVRRKQQRRERPLPKRYSAPLDLEAFFDRGVYLSLGGCAARGKEGGDERLGRLEGERCFCGHGAVSGWLVRGSEVVCSNWRCVSAYGNNFFALWFDYRFVYLRDEEIVAVTAR